MKRVLILVLSTEKEFYPLLTQASRATWDSVEVAGVETAFYFARSDQPSTDKLWFVNSDDDFYSMGKKTLAAFEYALANRQFDYVFRGNASLYIDKAGLAKYCLDKPEQNLALGVVSDSGVFEGEKFSFMWGPGFMLSRDVVQKVVDNQAGWNHRMMDDNAISRLLTSLEIPLDGRGSMASLAIKDGMRQCIFYEDGISGAVTAQNTKEIVAAVPNQFCFRVKDDSDRRNDIHLMRELHEAYQ